MNDDEHDLVSAEIDRRKLEKLVEDGELTREELENASVHIICKNGHHNPMWSTECETCRVKL